ncbi:MAG: hypothetical protein R2784_13635 [Saprospiraceae bacterium]
MHRSKLLEVIKTIKKEEHSDLVNFVRSPYFNNSYNAERYQELLEYLLASKPWDEDNPNLEKSKVYSILFPNDDFVPGKLEKIMSGLVNLIFKFIQIHHGNFESNPDLTLARYFRMQENDKLYQASLQKVINKIKKAKKQNVNYFREKLALEEEIETYNEIFNTRSEVLNLPQTLRNLDIYFILKRLSYTVSLLAQRIHINMDVIDAVKLIDTLKPLVDSEKYLQVPAIQVYLAAYNLLRSYGTNYSTGYDLFKNLLTENQAQLSQEENKTLQTILRIYAVGQYNRGDEAYKMESFQLFKRHLEAGYLYYMGKLFPSSFNSIVILGLRNGATDWVEEFIEAHKKKITGTSKPLEILNFNLANLHFYKGNYEEALNLLDDSYEDLYYKLGAKRLEIMIFFLEQSPLFDSRIEAFKIFIFRQSKSKLPDKIGEAYNNFIDILKQINNPKTYKNKGRLQKILDKINSTLLLSEKEWLRDLVSNRLARL